MIEPLQPFAPPAGLAVNIAPGTAIGWLFYAAFIVWVIYTLVAVYHWLRYSHAPAVAFPAIIIHLAASATIVSFALSGVFLS